MYRVNKNIVKTTTYGSLAIKLGVPRETINRIINGKQHCSKPYAIAICHVLKIELDEYFKEIK